MAHFHCGWTLGVQCKAVRSLENTCHTWTLLRWWFTTKRRYIKCTYLYFTFTFWLFDLETGEECRHGEPSSQFWLCDFSLSSYGQTCTRLTTCSLGLPVPKIWLIFGRGVKRPDDLDLGPWPWNWRRMSARTTFFPIVGASATVVVELRTNVHRTDTTWPYCIDLWLIWRQSACRWCGSSYSIPVPSLKFVAASLGRYGAFFVSALIGLVTLTSDLSTSKRGHGSPVSWASLVPMFCLLRPAFDLRHGTDGQTNNGHQRF